MSEISSSEGAPFAVESPRLGLPYLQAAQAQKHIAVNEGLAVLDDLAFLSVAARGRSRPPAAARDGQRFLIATTPKASGAWRGQDGKIAVRRDGAWFFYAPFAGMRLYVEDERQTLIHDGTSWLPLIAVQAASGARLSPAQIEASATLTSSSGSAVTVDLILPAGAVVFAVSSQVKETIVGVSAFSVGVADDPTRYGRDLRTQRNSSNLGLAGPTPYATPTPIVLTASGGAFTGGSLVLTSHHLLIAPPDPLPQASPTPAEGGA